MSQNFTFAFKFFMRRLLLISFLFLFSNSRAQFYLLSAENANTEKEQINPAFLVAHKVKSVRIDYSTKEDLQRIKSKNMFTKISFDAIGHPVHEITVKSSDTSETYIYFKEEKLSTRRNFAKGLIKTEYFDYDSFGRKIKEVHCKEENAGDDRNYFKILHQDIQWLETYAYQNLSPSQIQKNTYNDIGKVYKNAILYLDTKKRVKEEAERFSVTGLSQNYFFLYDELGRLIEKKFFSDVAGELFEKTTFTYDNKGNRTGESFYRNDILQFEKLYFYDANGEFPEAILIKYPNRTTIDMMKFQIELF